MRDKTMQSFGNDLLKANSFSSNVNHYNLRSLFFFDEQKSSSNIPEIL